MSQEKQQVPPELQHIAKELPNAQDGAIDSLDAQHDGHSEKVVDAIEMIGEEKAAGFPAGSPNVTPGMRYLHSSRTIHQLVTDRNRAVAIYLAVASLLLTASGAIYNAKPESVLIVPFDEIQRWCLPVAFASLTVLAFFMAILLIRTRVGLIYEVAKMNALLGLPLGRVLRIGWLSIHTVLQAMISCAGGASAALFSIFMIRLMSRDSVYLAAVVGTLIGLIVMGVLMAMYILTVTRTTADERLRDVEKIK